MRVTWRWKNANTLPDPHRSFSVCFPRNVRTSASWNRPLHTTIRTLSRGLRRPPVTMAVAACQLRLAVISSDSARAKWSALGADLLPCGAGPARCRPRRMAEGQRLMSETPLQCNSKENSISTEAYYVIFCTTARACPGFFTGPKSKGAGGVLRDGATTPSPQAGGPGSAVRTAQRFSTIFSTQDGLSWQYNIVNCVYRAAIGGQDPGALVYALAWLADSPIQMNLYCCTNATLMTTMKVTLMP